VRFADWTDDEVSLLNNLLGYIIVWGYDYKVDLIDVNESGYQAALTGGAVDVVAEVPKADAGEWLAAQSSAGAVVDAGSAFGAGSDIRIASTASLKQTAPEIAEFLRTVSADKAAIERLAAQITGGRTGVKPNVAALMYLKDNETACTSWVPKPVAEEVRAALAAGKTSLLRRNCIP